VLRALRDVIVTGYRHRQDPEDVIKGVHMIDAMGALLGRGDRTMMARMKATEQGRRLVAERRPVLELLADRDRLGSLPEGSLGREYARFAESKALFPEKLAEAVVEARKATGGYVAGATEEHAFLHDRYRDLHDLWHVVTGYGTDLAGEYGIVAFQSRQTGYRAMTVMSFFSVLATAVSSARPDLLGIWFDGRRRGREAVFLLSQDWDALVELPLEVVREQLGLSELPSYRPFDYEKSARQPAQAA